MKEDNAILFITGSYKTASSSLVGILNCHPKIFMLYETDLSRGEISKYGRHFLEAYPDARHLFRYTENVGRLYHGLKTFLSDKGHSYHIVGDKLVDLNQQTLKKVLPYRVIHIVRDIRSWLSKDAVRQKFMLNHDIIPAAIDYTVHFMESFLLPRVLRLRMEDLILQNESTIAQIGSFLDIDLLRHTKCWWEKVRIPDPNDPKYKQQWWGSHNSTFLQPQQLDTNTRLTAHPFWQDLMPVFEKYYQGAHQIFSPSEVEHDISFVLKLARRSPFPLREAFAASRETPLSKIDQGIRLHQKGNVTEAAAIYKGILESDPENSEANHLLGVACLDTGNYAGAIPFLEKALSINPSPALYHYNLGNAFLGCRRLDDAAACYEAVINKESDSFKAYNNLGNIFRQKNELNKAASLYRKAIESKPDYSDAYINLGSVLHRTGHLDDAIWHYERAVSIEPQNPNAYHNLGNIQFSRGCIQEAIDSYQQAVQVKPDFREASISLNALSMGGDNFLTILKKLHLFCKPATYFETLVVSEQSLALAEPPTRVIGLSMKPIRVNGSESMISIYPYSAENNLTSSDMKKILEEKNIDLAFIHDRHLFDRILVDLLRIERHLSKNSIAVIQDTVPQDDIASGRKETQPFWCGDAWKIVPCLKKYRPALSVFTVEAMPTGITIVTGFDAESDVLQNNFDTIVQEFKKWDYAELEADKTGLLNIVPNDMHVILHKLTTDPVKPFMKESIPV